MAALHLLVAHPGDEVGYVSRRYVRQLPPCAKKDERILPQQGSVVISSRFSESSAPALVPLNPLSRICPKRHPRLSVEFATSNVRLSRSPQVTSLFDRSG